MRDEVKNPGPTDRLYPDSSTGEAVSEEHESYGLLSVNRASTGGEGRNLFGSSIRHGTFLTFRLKRAEKRRQNNRTWIGSAGKEMIAEFEMSPAQWADLLTSLNVGEGIPVTLRYVNGEEMEACPEVSQRQIFEKEFRNDVTRATENAKRLIERVNNFIETKGVITKKDSKQLAEDLKLLLQDLQSNMPFVQKQFTAAMDRTTTEAKHEIENFVNGKIASLGINALAGQVMEVLAAAESSSSLQLSEGSPDGESE